jgi:hypothetical protein
MISIIAGLDFLYVHFLYASHKVFHLADFLSPRLFGYDQGVMGGLLTLNSFVATFPQIDTTKAGEMGLSAAERSTRSTVQGM